MNTIYRLIGDAQNNAFVAVSENTKVKGKKTSKTLLAMTLLSALGASLSSNAIANPNECNPFNLICLANSASGSADLASGSADLASGSADLASKSADLASGSADLASGSADLASKSAGAARDYATAAAKQVDNITNNIDAIFRDSNTYTDLSNRINQNSADMRKNRKLAAQGIAGLAAMTNIPSPAIAGTTSIGTGVGYFDNESAISIGASHYFDNNISIKGSIANGFNSGKSTVVGTGISYTWK